MKYRNGYEMRVAREICFAYCGKIYESGGKTVAFFNPSPSTQELPLSRDALGLLPLVFRGSGNAVVDRVGTLKVQPFTHFVGASLNLGTPWAEEILSFRLRSIPE